MSFANYLIIQQIIMAIGIALGVQLLFDVMPKELKGSGVYYSHRFMGIAICIVPIFSFIYYFLGMIHWDEKYALVINLSAYYLTMVFMSISYLLMLSKSVNWRIMHIYMFSGIIYCAALWLSVWLGTDCISEHSQVIAYTIFCMFGVGAAAICIWRYVSCRSDVVMSNKEYQWIGRSLIVNVVIMFVALLSPSFFSYPLWLGMVFVVSFILAVIGIFICYRNVVLYRLEFVLGVEIVGDVEAVEAYCDEEEDVVELSDQESLNADIQREIEERLSVWLEAKGYTQCDVSLVTLAKEVYTNRTYLSKYINICYGCSFRSWITSLRIDEAKHLLMSSPNLTMPEVAAMIGSSSSDSFVRVFTNHVGMSPVRWREELSETVADEVEPDHEPEMQH